MSNAISMFSTEPVSVPYPVPLFSDDESIAILSWVDLFTLDLDCTVLGHWVPAPNADTVICLQKPY